LVVGLPYRPRAVTGPEPLHLNPATAVAERVLLPGDPQRALAVSQALLEEPKMMNTRRGLWGYTGRAADGGLVTVQSTGMGGPSAAIVAEELIGLGARVLVRIGTCGALTDDLELGELVTAASAIAADGTSRALGAEERAEPDSELAARLAADARPVTVVSTDVFYETRAGIADGWVAAGARAVEMESATLFTLARRHGVRAGSLLAVSDVLLGDRERLEQAALDAVGVELGRVALAALL
jgi:DeoD family purine-nucleoside phosphorylase